MLGERKAFELPPRSEEFPRWFDEVLFKAEIVDSRYPVKGMYVWLPYGYEIMSRIMEIMEELLREAGHKRVYFPGVVPESVLSREFKFKQGFEGSVYWITRLGREEAPERMALRPTSEAIMYEVLSRWIKSYADLPLKIYQIVPVYRYETKATRPLLRVREIAFFKEAHTFHSSYEEAAAQVEEGVRIYRDFYDRLLIPYIVVKTPKWDTFPGAHYNYDVITVMPDGKALELGSVINFGDIFAGAYELKYMDRDGKMKNVNTTSYGISERSLAAVIAIHGDDRGMRLPPEIAPVQVVVVPIPKKGEEELVASAAREAEERIRSLGLRTVLDDSEERPGYKYYKWEVRGVPLRVEVGPGEARGGFVSVVKRTAPGRRIRVELDSLAEEIPSLLEEVREDLLREALEYFRGWIREANTLEEVVELVGSKIVSFPWCGDEECGHEVEEAAGYSLLGYEENALLGSGASCVACGREAPHRAWIGRSY